MNVKQQIMIGSLRVNTISNSSILQIGSTGLIQAYAKDTDEYYSISETSGTGGKQQVTQMEDASIPIGNEMDDLDSAIYPTVED